MQIQARRYADALFQAAHPQGALDAVLADLEAVVTALAHADEAGALSSPDTPRPTVARVFERVGAGRHVLVRGLFGVMVERRREALLPAVLAALRTRILAERGIAEGCAESAQELDAGQMERLTTIAQELTGKQVTLSKRVVPALLGGVRLRIGNTLYDGTVATALEDLRKQLLDVPLPG